MEAFSILSQQLIVKGKWRVMCHKCNLPLGGENCPKQQNIYQKKKKVPSLKIFTNEVSNLKRSSNLTQIQRKDRQRSVPSWWQMPQYKAQKKKQSVKQWNPGWYQSFYYQDSTIRYDQRAPFRFKVSQTCKKQKKQEKNLCALSKLPNSVLN